MKRLTTILFCLVMAISVRAQEHRKFSPEKFQADLEAYITREAHFDQQEAAKYFPLLREMQAKQRAIYARMYKKEKPSGDAKCAEAIANYDKANIELKQLDQTYHKKMMKVVPASKVFDVHAIITNGVPGEYLPRVCFLSARVPPCRACRPSLQPVPDGDSRGTHGCLPPLSTCRRPRFG